MSHQSHGEAPKRRPRPKTVILLLVGVTTLYLISYAAMYAVFGNVDILPDWNDIFESSDKLVSAGEKSVDSDEEPPLRREGDDKANRAPKERFLRQEPVVDNVPLYSLLDKPPTPTANAGAGFAVPAPAPKAQPLPGGVFLEKPIHPTKCWDQNGFEQAGAACDALDDFQKLFEGRLFLADQCRKEVLGPLHTGVLSVAAELDFVRSSLSLWEGSSSTLHRAKQVVDCFHEALGDVKVSRFKHHNARYRFEFNITFGRRRELVAQRTSTAAEPRPAEAEIAEALAEAKVVKVTRDRVRVRKAPVDGEIIGFVSSPQKVQLAEQKGEWCLVKTKRGNLGWMVCWGLEIK